MRKTHLLDTINIRLLLLLAVWASSFNIIAAPRLTIFIAVDGLNEASLELLRPYWSQGGLRTLSEEAFQTEVAYPHHIYGGCESLAAIMTGVTPRENGYAMDYYFSRQDRKSHQLLEDKNERGIGCTAKLSARALLSNTITDEFRLKYNKSKIYAIGIHPEPTLVMAGHGADACCWLDNENTRWATTSYYSDGLPSAADQMNITGRLTELASRVWTPRLDIPMYNRATDTEKKKSFSYHSQDVLRQSPVANTMVIELALNMQKKEHLGEDNIPDLLLLELTTLSPKATSDHIQSAEQEDMYLALNQDLGYLMEQLSRRIGKDNFDIMLVGFPRLGIGNEAAKQTNRTVNTFNVDRAAALTATYLMALYGHERWIDGGYGNAIYLNRTLIEQKRLSLETIQRQVANFLIEFEGIQMAYPSHEAILQNELRESLNKKCMGDIVFTLEPGWQLMENDKKILDNVLESSPHSPLLWWSATHRQWPQHTLNALDIKNLLK